MQKKIVSKKLLNICLQSSDKNAGYSMLNRTH